MNGSKSNVQSTTDITPHDGNYQAIIDRVKSMNQSLPDAMNNISLGQQDPFIHQRAMGLNFSTFNDVIIQDGPSTGKLRTKYFDQKDMTPIKDLKGSVSKTRYFGQSHWMQSFEQVSCRIHISDFRRLTRG